jgi:hypothetical protein
MDHFTAEQSCPLPSELHFWCRPDGISARLADPLPAPVVDPIPEQDPPETPVFAVSLGISLPCQVMHANLRMSCTVAYHS